MNQSLYTISLDVQASYAPTAISMKQFDTGRRLEFALHDGGKPYEIGADCQVVFTAKKPDGTAIFNTCQVEKGKVIYELTPQTTAEPGKVRCELRIYGADESLITSAAFQILVLEQVCADDDVVAATPEATALQKLVDDIGAISVSEGTLRTDRVEATTAYLDDAQMFRIYATEATFSGAAITAVSSEMANVNHGTVQKLTATEAAIANMPFTLALGTEDTPVVLEELPRGVYLVEGVGKLLAPDVATEMTPGLYVVSVKDKNRVIFAFEAGEENTLTKYVITETRYFQKKFNLDAIGMN